MSTSAITRLPLDDSSCDAACPGPVSDLGVPAVLAMLAVVAAVLLIVHTGFMAKLLRWLQLHTAGPADLSAKLLYASNDKVLMVDTLHWGKITYIGR